MNNIKIVNTHSHVNMLKETNIEQAIDNAQKEGIFNYYTVNK